MKIDFEYGHGTMAAELPDNTDVFVPGETVADPPAIAESEIVEKTRAAIQNPMGMKPIPELVGPESKVAIIFPDRVKGGSHPTAHRKVSIPLLIEECVKAGVKKGEPAVHLLQRPAPQEPQGRDPHHSRR